VEAVRRAVSDLVLPPRAGWLVTNPPYGHRVGDTSGGQDLRNLYDRLGTVLRERASGWHVALLAAHDTPISRMKLPLQPTLTTLNGGISVAVHTGTLGGPGGVGSAATQRSATPESVATESAPPESVDDAAASAEPESE
jgi:hypothetical protein